MVVARLQNQLGFTLIELLVSMTIFTTVMTIAAGSLLVLLDANSKAQNMQAILNDLTIAIDSMTREVRTGYNYYCQSLSSAPSTVPDVDDARSCTGGGNFLAVVEAGGNYDSGLTGSSAARISYYYDSDEEALYRRLDTGNWVQLTAPGVQITTAEFVVEGADSTSSDDEQPNITVFIEGEAGQLVETDADFIIQTSITQRPIDI